MQNKELFESLTADMNTGVKRVHNNPSLLAEMDLVNLQAYFKALDAYSPIKPEAQDRRGDVMKMVSAMIEVKSPQVTERVTSGTARNIANNSFVLELHTREPSFSKKVDSAEFFSVTKAEESGIAQDRISVSKKLITNKEIKKLKQHRHYFIKSLKSLSLPGGLLTLGNGQFLIPLSLLATVKERIDQYLSRRTELLDEFESRYSEVIALAKERLGPLFDSSDYQPFDLVRECYGTDYKYISNRVPEEFAKISQEIYDSEQQRILSECAGTASLIDSHLQNKFVELVQHLEDKLQPDPETGKPRKLQESTLTNLKDFVNVFSEMNLTGNSKLAELVKSTEALLGGADIKKVRTDEEFRTELDNGFKGILEATSKMVAPLKRKVILKDEDDE